MDSPQLALPGNPLAEAAALQRRYQDILRRMVGSLPKTTALEIVRKHYRDRHSGEEMPEAEAMARYLGFFAPTPEK